MKPEKVLVAIHLGRDASEVSLEVIYGTSSPCTVADKQSENGSRKADLYGELFPGYRFSPATLQLFWPTFGLARNFSRKSFVLPPGSSIRALAKFVRHFFLLFVPRGSNAFLYLASFHEASETPKEEMAAVSVGNTNEMVGYINSAKTAKNA